MSITIRTDAKSLLETFAALKKIPMQKVIRNAARDFAKAVLPATPLGKRALSPYAKIKGKDGKIRYIHVAHEMAKYRRRVRKRQSDKETADSIISDRAEYLRKHRLLRKGWSKASWIGLYRALELPPKSKGTKLPRVVESLADVKITGSGTNSQATITNPIHFEGLPGAAQEIVQAGLDRGARFIVKEFNRIITRIVRK